MSFLAIKKRILGFLAGVSVVLLQKNKKNSKKIAPQNIDFTTSTQRIGVYFPEDKRRLWRKNWVNLNKRRYK